MNIVFEIFYENYQLVVLKNKVRFYVNGVPNNSGGIITQWENKNCVMYSFGSNKPELLEFRSDWVAVATYPFKKI